MYTKTSYKTNLERYWRQFFPEYEIPAGFIIHHITPRGVAKQNGWDDYKINHPRNLIALHPDDHVAIHKCRGDKFVAGNHWSTVGFSNKGKGNGMYGVEPWNKGTIGKTIPWNKGLKIGPRSEETKKKISNANKGRLGNRLGCEPWNKGKTNPHAKTEQLNNERFCCEHCNKTTNKGNYTRWHGDNCKECTNG